MCGKIEGGRSILDLGRFWVEDMGGRNLRWARTSLPHAHQGTRLEGLGRRKEQKD